MGAVGAMDLSRAIRDEATRVLPVVRSTLTFSITFQAAEQLLANRFDKGLFLVVTTLGALLVLLGLQIKCRNCIQTLSTAWWSPVLALADTLLDASASIATAFASNLIANALVKVLVTAESPEWVVWWSAVGLGLVSVALNLIAQ